MADGKSHDAITVWSTGLVMLVTLALTRDNAIALCTAAGNLIGGLYLSPDLDIPSRPWRRWWIFRFLWMPYQRSIPHRHYLSHSPVIGTVGRLLYIGIPLSLLLGAIGMLDEATALAFSHWRLVLAAVVGIEISCILHLAADGILFKK